MDLSLADDVVGLIDDMENGLYLPDNITDVEVVNSMPDDPDEARRGWEKAKGLTIKPRTNSRILSAHLPRFLKTQPEN